jgi:hypothetical protein
MSGLIRELNWEIVIVWQGAFIGIALKENELWLVIKAFGSRLDTQASGGDL